MQVSGASDLASKGQVSSDTSTLRVKGEPEDSFRQEVKVRCVCGSSLETDSMIQVNLEKKTLCVYCCLADVHITFVMLKIMFSSFIFDFSVRILDAMFGSMLAV